MNDVIENVLNDETLTTNEERVDAIKKGLATLVIPKDKYNDLSAKLKTTESNYSTLSNEYEEFKKSKMTEDEKKQAEFEEFNSKKLEVAKSESKYAVKDLFEEKGIKLEKEKMDKILNDIVTDNKEQTLAVANTIASVLLETAEQTKKQTTVDLLNGTPKPIVGNPNNNNASNLDTYKAKLDEAIKNKDVVAQATYTRLIQEEQQKQLKPKM